jgi:hypothetical protein
MNTNNGTAQCARLLKRLQMGPIDTFTAIRELNILRPGARISELRDLGHKIFTHRLVLTDDQGRTHRRIALYYLSTNPPDEVSA